MQPPPKNTFHFVSTNTRLTDKIVKIPAHLVSKLLEDEEAFSFDDIKAYVAGHKVSLADGIEFNIGFAIGTSTEDEIEANVEIVGLPAAWPSIDWEEINNAVQRLEQNAVRALSNAGVSCHPEGHAGDSSELVGTAYVTGGTPGFEIVWQQVERGERFHTGEGTMPEAISVGLHAGIDPEIARLVDVSIEFFDTDKIERVEHGEE
jgi:hypothetical protein